jgi:protein involved in polysaccharide export with SLBB domain
VRQLLAFNGFLYLCAFPIFGQPALAAPFDLGPGDLIEISVMSRPELTRPYRVRLDGAISLHILGNIQAEGKSPADLEAELEEQFSDVFEGSTSITVEVVRYRPVIVGGQVAAPGAYEYMAGLDVARVVALAGGVGVGVAADTVSTQMRVEAESARYELLRARLASRLLERARLSAERDGSDSIAMPAEAEAVLGAAASDLLEAQTNLRASRESQLSLRLAAEDSRRILAEDEAEAYAERRALIRSQVDATMEELLVQQGLAERGLALSQRSLDLRLSADRFRADELEAVALEASAREKVSTAVAGKETATAQREGEVAATLTGIDAEIAEIRTDMGLARRFVTTFGDPASSAMLTGADTQYRIRRYDGKGVTVIEANLDTVVHPGDMVEVVIDDPLPAAQADQVKLQADQ